MEIKYLEWDSSHFGIKVGELSLATYDSSSLDCAISQAKLNDYDLLYLKGVSLPHELLSNRLILADQKVIFSKINSNCFSSDGNIVSWRNHQLDCNLLSLVFQSGGYSRYYTDKNMPIHVFLNLYKTWILDSLNGCIATDVLVYKQEGSILGFLTFKETDNLVTVGLISVDYQKRGKGIGMKLMNSLFSRIPKGKRIEVATQNVNTNACHFYEKCGFIEDSITNIYHIWIK